MLRLPLPALSAIILPSILILASFVAAGLPHAYASTCSSTGGSGGSGYYYAEGISQDGDVYGVEGIITPNGAWTYNSGSNGHSLAFVNLIFDDGTGTHYMQVGIGIGNVQSQTQTTRQIYFEHNVPGDVGVLWVTGSSYTIPDYDSGTAKDYNYQTNGDGTYKFQLSYNSPSAGSWSTQVNTKSSSLYSGHVYAVTENAYFNSYNSTCNGVSENDHGSMSYSTSVSTSPTWYSWGGSSCSYSQNSPYSVSTSLCPTYWSESGA